MISVQRHQIPSIVQNLHSRGLRIATRSIRKRNAVLGGHVRHARFPGRKFNKRYLVTVRGVCDGGGSTVSRYSALPRQEYKPSSSRVEETPRTHTRAPVLPTNPATHAHTRHAGAFTNTLSSYTRSALTPFLFLHRTSHSAISL